ncbi:MAG: muconate cycloisomerase, partial [Chloroflexota bacterium]
LDWPCDNTGPQLYTADVLQAPLRYEDGYLILPQGPGLGISVDELRVRSHAPDTPFPVRAHPAEER